MNLKSIKSISVLVISLIIRNMATPLLAESYRSKRGKDKLIILGFIYTINKSNNELNHWVCENPRPLQTANEHQN